MTGEKIATQERTDAAAIILLELFRRKRKKENRQPKGGMGERHLRHAATFRTRKKERKKTDNPRD